MAGLPGKSRTACAGRFVARRNKKSVILPEGYYAGKTAFPAAAGGRWENNLRTGGKDVEKKKEKEPQYRAGDCRFCYDLALVKYLDREERTDVEGIYHTYTAALVCRTHKRGYGAKGSVVHRARPLNYCPECGRALKVKNKEHRGKQ